MKLREFVELSPILLPWATVPSLTSRALKLCQPGSSVSAHTTGSLDALKLSLDDSLIALASAFSEEEGERCAEELLVKNRPFTALVCANDRLAIGAIAALQRHGVICPDDVSVTGLHDMPFASRLQPPPTTIRIQHNKAGIEAAEVMVQLLESPLSEKARHIVLPTELIIRQSTKAVRAGELDGSEAHQTPPIEQSSKAAALSGRRKGRG